LTGCLAIEKLTSQPRFLVDEMLGEIARWLRLLGYDTHYFKDMSDQRLIEHSKRENRVLLTCDHELHKRAIKKGVCSLLLGSTTLVNRLLTLAETYGLELRLNPADSRCPICNGVIKEVTDEGRLEGRVPERVRNKNKEFWICTSCNRVYWIGGHWKNIRRTFDEVRDRMAEQP
jgi:uncharacterized protein with PIN domain